MSLAQYALANEAYNGTRTNRLHASLIQGPLAVLCSVFHCKRRVGFLELSSIYVYRYVNKSNFPFSSILRPLNSVCVFQIIFMPSYHN